MTILGCKPNGRFDGCLFHQPDEENTQKWDENGQISERGIYRLLSAPMTQWGPRCLVLKFRTETSITVGVSGLVLVDEDTQVWVWKFRIRFWLRAFVHPFSKKNLKFLTSVTESTLLSTIYSLSQFKLDSTTTIWPRFNSGSKLRSLVTKKESWALSVLSSFMGLVTTELTYFE